MTGGTIGDISVVWSVLAADSNASRDSDYVADGATLTFLSGDSVRGMCPCCEYNVCTNILVTVYPQLNS